MLRGQLYPRAEGLQTLRACRAAVDAAVAYMDAATPADLSIDTGADVGLWDPPGATMTASNFLLKLSYGHFFFHITTAYDILRHPRRRHRQGRLHGRCAGEGAGLAERRAAA